MKDSESHLKFCEAQGMQLHFISRKAYRLKEKPNVLKPFLENQQDAYVIPEGGTNALAVKGCREILLRRQ